jgi:hypothetical protein
VLGSGFGAVLHQGDGPITFFSRAVAPHHAKLPAYERELIGLVKVVRHWGCMSGDVFSGPNSSLLPKIYT